MFNARPFLFPFPALLAYMVSEMHFSLTREGMHCCTFACKARSRNASDNRRIPECFYSVCYSCPLICEGSNSPSTAPLKHGLQLAPLLNKIFTSLFPSPSTLQKIQQQIRRGEKETSRNKVNLSLAVKLTRKESFSPLTWKHWSVLICSAKTDQQGDAHGDSVSHKYISSNWMAYGLP